MSRIVVYTAASASARANLEHSIIAGVDVGELAASRMFADLQRRTEDGKIRLWGIQPGARGQKRASWLRVEAPAVAFFYLDGGFRLTATVWSKEPPRPDGDEGNPAVARAVWGDPSYELIGYLEDIEVVDVASQELKAALGYRSNYPLGRESVVPGQGTQDAILAAFVTPSAFRDSVVGHVGTPQLEELPASLPTDALGTSYRRADENARAERGDSFAVDPDVIDRGTRGHARTQNLLAEALETRGLEPKSPSIAEPPYDLAWDADGKIFVAEVKSITRLNEERQLRLALGQVLRYAHQLAYKRKPVQKVIAVERKPSDATWMQLCASHDVKLIWPEVFSEA